MKGKKTIILSGGSGLIGSAIIESADPQTTFIRIGRKVTNNKNDFSWDTLSRNLNQLEGTIAWINLAGASVSKYWFNSYKKTMIKSRLATTEKCVEIMAKLRRPPSVFINASAIGYYGNAFPGHLMDDKGQPGSDFLAKLCQEWEDVALKAQSITRVVLPRIGIVLSAKGGAYTKIQLPFRLGLGGCLGSGKQGFPWVHIEDVVSVFQEVINNDKIQGSFNLVAPEKTTMALFTQKIADQLNRPSIMAIPDWLLRSLLGEMATIILDTPVISPVKIINLGYKFKYNTLNDALKKLAK